MVNMGNQHIKAEHSNDQSTATKITNKLKMNDPKTELLCLYLKKYILYMYNTLNYKQVNEPSYYYFYQTIFRIKI